MTAIPASCCAPSVARVTCSVRKRLTVFSSVRGRLTLWYVSVFAIVLVAFSIAGYLLLARSLYDRLDARLASTLEASTAALKPVLSGPTTNVVAMVGVLEDLRFPNQTI